MRYEIPYFNAFQLTTSRRGRQVPLMCSICCNEISTHDLTRRSTGFLGTDKIICFYFNSRPRKKVDTRRITSDRKTCNISTRDLARRSTFQKAKREQVWLFQLATSQGSRLYRRGNSSFGCIISTHDLTKRSTDCCIHLIICSYISTHDLTKRSTGALCCPRFY